MSVSTERHTAPTVAPAAAPGPAAALGRPSAPLVTAGWVDQLRPPGPEPLRQRLGARVGALLALTALLAYLTWRVTSTMPADPAWQAWALLGFETLPLPGLLVRLVTLWDIDSRAPRTVTELPAGTRVAVMVPTYNEPAEVIAPTIAAACALEPAHETWVLDDGDRDWVAELCATYGARYVRREHHDHAKAGNLNHALELIARECAESGAPDVELVAVLDCDHVPLPHFLTATLGWFDDPDVALVQGPQNYYNSGAFDDDGCSGEQGMFFNVLMPARNHDGAGPFWCGSTSVLRMSALREIGGVATETIIEDMHSTLGLIRAGWKTVYHHQTLALGLAPATAEQYLLQRRRWGLGAMQVLVIERLWAAKSWLSWRNFYEYLTGTVWWLEGVGTLLAFFVPAIVVLSGAPTTDVAPVVFVPVFVSLMVFRVLGIHLLFRGQLHFPTALALRVFRVPIGLSCLWWLLTRRTLEFQVTPKAGADERAVGRVPRVLWVVLAANLLLLGWSLARSLARHGTPGAWGGTVAVSLWVLVSTGVLVMGVRRIRDADYASSRRNAHRVALQVPVALDGHDALLADVSVSGAAVALPREVAARYTADQPALLVLPGCPALPVQVVRVGAPGDLTPVSLRVAAGDWATHRALSLWMFHTPPGAVPGLPESVPAVGVRSHA